MGMRKYQRNLIKNEGKFMGYKPSKYLKAKWDDIQTKKYGMVGRVIRRACGAKKSRTWAGRIAVVVPKLTKN